MASTPGFRFFTRALSAHGHCSQAKNAFYQAQSLILFKEVRSLFFRSWASPYPSTIDLTAGVITVPDQPPPAFRPPAALPAEAIDWFTAPCTIGVRFFFAPTYSGHGPGPTNGQHFTRPVYATLWLHVAACSCVWLRVAACGSSLLWLESVAFHHILLT